MTSSLRWLRRRGPIVVLLTWVVAIVALVVAPAPATAYPAVASFVVPSGANTVGPGSANEAITLAGIYAQLIPKDDALLKSATTDLNVTRTELVKNLTVTVSGNTSLILLKFQAETRQRSLIGLNDISTALIAGVSSAIPAGSIVQVAAPVIEVKTSGLSHGERLTFGIILGLVLGVILAVAWGRRDRRVDTAEALSHILGTPVTPLKQVTEWEARSLLQRWLATSERGSTSVAILTCPSYGRDPARWLEANFALIGPPVNFGVVSVALDKGAVEDGTAQPKLLFGGAAGSDTALAATLLTDVVVLAISAETPMRDVETAFRVLAQHGVRPKWGLLVSRAAVRAEARRSRDHARQARRIAAAELAASAEPRPLSEENVDEIEPIEAGDLIVTEVDVVDDETATAHVAEVAHHAPEVVEVVEAEPQVEGATGAAAPKAAADESEVAAVEQRKSEPEVSEVVRNEPKAGGPVEASNGTAETTDAAERAEWAQWAERARAKWAKWAEQGDSPRAADTAEAEAEAEAERGAADGQRTGSSNGNRTEASAAGLVAREFGVSRQLNGNGHKGSETVTKT